MCSHVIGPAVAPIIQNLNVKTVAKGNELLACQVSLQVKAYFACILNISLSLSVFVTDSKSADIL